MDLLIYSYRVIDKESKNKLYFKSCPVTLDPKKGYLISQEWRMNMFSVTGNLSIPVE